MKAVVQMYGGLTYCGFNPFHCGVYRNDAMMKRNIALSPNAVIEGFDGDPSKHMVFAVLSQEQIKILEYKKGEDTGRKCVASKISKKRKNSKTHKNPKKDADEEITKKLRQKSHMKIHHRSNKNYCRLKKEKTKNMESNKKNLLPVEQLVPNMVGNCIGIN